jgi:glutathione-regulated potassium-efflux system ancillary protein KefG
MTLVDAQEVVALLGLAQRNSVATYQRRYADMPRPVIERSGGQTKLWSRSAVLAWARQTGRPAFGSASAQPHLP